MRDGFAALSAVLFSALLLAAISSAQSPPAPLQPAAPPQPEPALNRPGRFALEVAVTGTDGMPVAGLTASDFHLEDNGKPTPILTFSHGEPADAFQVVLIVDELNPGSWHMRNAAQEFLSHAGGHLAWPVSVYLLNGRGLVPLAGPSRDGNALAEQVAHPQDQSKVGRLQERQFAELTVQDRMIDPRFKATESMDALGAVILRLRDQPGHKLVVWMGGGWDPVPVEFARPLDMITEFSTRMREARMILDWVDDEKPPWFRGFLLNDFLGPALIDATAIPARMALPVLALQSGGQILATPDIPQALSGFAEQAAQSYTITFDPADTERVDDYHALRVTVSRPGAEVRTRSGYYDEPSYYDHPSTDVYHLTVAELDSFLRNPRNVKDPDLLRKLAHTQLTERLSTPHLEQLLPLLKEEKDKEQLEAVADASAFLRLPAAEMPNDPAPSLQEQRAIVQSAFKYLKDTIPKLPDFFAERKIVFYEPRPLKVGSTWKGFTGDASVHPAGVSTSTVLYRDGKEVVSDERDKNQHGYSHHRALTSSGEFGVALSAILYGAVDGGTVGWDHWERGPAANEAVFHMHVPVRGSHFATTYCCMPQDHGTAVFHRVGAYHGEFAVDVKTGAILRMAVSADFDLAREPDLPLASSGTVIEYGPVDIGGSTFISALRSVWVSRGRTVTQIEEWGGSVFVYGPFEDDINDISFSNYHRFGSQSRILTGVEDTPQNGTSPPAAPPR